MKTYRVAVIAGDGIGKEVVPEGIGVLEAAANRFGFAFEWRHFDWSCERYVKTGRMMPEDGIAQLRPFDAIFLGAVGHPDVPDHISLWGLLIPIRRSFLQYVNLRPVRLFDGIETPLKNWKPGDISFQIVRENVEGEYSNIGGRMYQGTEEEMAIQQTIFTRRGVTRVIRYAFELARKSKKHLTSATKSNGIIFTMPFWDECFKEIAAEYPDVRTDQYPHRHSHRAFRASSRLVRRGRRLKSFRRHTFRPRSGGRRLDRHRAIRQSESRARIPVDVRAGARLRAGHRREGNCESDRPDLVWCDDAASSRGSTGCRCGGIGDR